MNVGGVQLHVVAFVNYENAKNTVIFNEHLQAFFNLRFFFFFFIKQIIRII